MWVDIIHQFSYDSSIERTGDNRLIESFNIQFQFVFQFCQFFDSIGFWIIYLWTLPFLPFDSFRIQFRLDLIRRFMIHQISIYYRFPIRISKDRHTENSRRMECRCSSQSNDKSIKVFDDTFVLAYIVGLVSERKVFFIQLLVLIISSVGFVHDDTIVCIDRQLVLLIICSIEQSLHHTLYGSKLNTCFYFGILFAKLIYLIDVCKRIEVLNFVIIKVVTSLFCQRPSVGQEKNTTETIGLNQPIRQTYCYTGLSCTCGHHQQSTFVTSQNSFLYRFNCIDLIITQTQSILVRQV